MNNFINVVKGVPQTRIKDVLDKYNRLPLNYHPKIRYGTLIQNVILEEIINLMGDKIEDIAI